MTDYVRVCVCSIFTHTHTTSFKALHELPLQTATSPSIDNYLSPVENLSLGLPSQENHLQIQLSETKG